jgi:signal transduction histidine kinase
VRGNPFQLQIVLMSLMASACRAKREQGGRLSIVAAQRDGEVELAISDSAAVSDGTPLGLFVSQRIIQAHKGSLEVRATEERGTTVVIRLPAVQAASPHP